MEKKELDYLFIPNGSGPAKKQRMQRAKQESKGRKITKIVSMKGKDSEENVLFMGKILKKGDKAGIVTFPLHFKEYQEIIRKAKQESKFPKSVSVEGILTSQTGKEFVYGELGLEEEKIFEKKVDYEKNKKKGMFSFVKDFVKKILDFI